MVSEQQLNRLVERIVAGYAPEAIGIFGSYAVDLATEKSDLDIAVIIRQPDRPVVLAVNLHCRTHFRDSSSRTCNSPIEISNHAPWSFWR